MTKRSLRRARRAAAALAVGGGLLIAAGCGHDSMSGDAAAGKTQFANLCASCHTLADSGKPPSQIGPSLDDAFRASRQAGFNEQQFAGVVLRWITEAQQPMPRDLVKGQDAKDVAAYVASVAGRTPNSAVFAAEETPEVPDPPRQDQAPPGRPGG
jgi:mono/diheme cytochrome c family protein